MKKFIPVFILALVFALGATVALAGNGSAGPTEKVTGTIVTVPANPALSYAVSEFNAFEESAKGPAKGMYHWWAYNPDGSLYREIIVEVTKANIEGDTATFSGFATYDSFDTIVGNEFSFYAMDGGTPGSGNDLVSWGWPGLNEKEIIGGNLTVHSYEELD
ncbi:hypothetical protein C0583_01560 [Candidatus Parcubacteria bacterium]|nr:MAG: hypothetical protein C0583_01560 [Candidatus Parcubacteria bacterium]